jgi:hypothetical protein
MPAQESTAKEVQLKHPPATTAPSPGTTRTHNTSIISSFSSVGGGGSICVA